MLLGGGGGGGCGGGLQHGWILDVTLKGNLNFNLLLLLFPSLFYITSSSNWIV